jgi:hypothetical protein
MRGAEESSEADSDSSGGPPQPHPPPLADMRPMENNARYWSVLISLEIATVDALLLYPNKLKALGEGFNWAMHTHLYNIGTTTQLIRVKIEHSEVGSDSVN